MSSLSLLRCNDLRRVLTPQGEARKLRTPILSDKMTCVSLVYLSEPFGPVYFNTAI